MHQLRNDPAYDYGTDLYYSGIKKTRVWKKWIYDDVEERRELEKTAEYNKYNPECQMEAPAGVAYVVARKEG